MIYSLHILKINKITKRKPNLLKSNQNGLLMKIILTFKIKINITTIIQIPPVIGTNLLTKMINNY